jgi:hypothetical protein
MTTEQERNLELCKTAARRVDAHLFPFTCLRNGLLNGVYEVTADETKVEELTMPFRRRLLTTVPESLRGTLVAQATAFAARMINDRLGLTVTLVGLARTELALRVLAKLALKATADSYRENRLPDWNYEIEQAALQVEAAREGWKRVGLALDT